MRITLLLVIAFSLVCFHANAEDGETLEFAYKLLKEDGKWTEGLFTKKITDKDIYQSISDDYLFFDGNNCTGNIIGSFWPAVRNVDKNPLDLLAKETKNFKNDAAKSVMIVWSVKDEYLAIFDSPKRSEARNDDRTLIHFTRMIVQPICIGSFQKKYENKELGVSIKMVKQSPNHKPDLDGNVSRVYTGPFNLNVK